MATRPRSSLASASVAILVGGILAFEGLPLSPTQSEAAPPQSTRTAKAPSLQQNQQLMDSLDQTIAQNQQALDAHERDLLVDFGLKVGEDASPIKRLRDAFGHEDTAYGSYQSQQAYDSRQYEEALYQFIVAVAGVLEGPIGTSVEATDLLREVAETWVIGRYQAKLVEQEWNLKQSINYAQFKDPANQAEFKRILDRLNDDLPSERTAFKSALAKAGLTEQALFKSTGTSDPIATTAVRKGIQIVDPEFDAVSSPVRRQDCVDALYSALGVLTRCNDRVAACQSGCAGSSNYATCYQACGNCDSEQAAWQQAMDRLNQFDLKQAQQGWQSQP